jgi:hypothetical protein
MDQPKPCCQTIRYNEITEVLETTVIVSHPNLTKHVSCKGIWDTGATRSMISSIVFDELGLDPKHIASVASLNGRQTFPVFKATLALDIGFAFRDVYVIGAETIADEYHVLLGMDIISQLDFSISNADGSTTHSIRFPSTSQIDFTRGDH